MASKALATTALFLSLNLLFLTMVSATHTRCPPSAPKTPKSPTNPSVPKPPSQNSAHCPINTLKLGVCANVLDLVNPKVGSPPTLPCCSLIEGLVDLEAASCLCTVLKANVLGINLNIPLSLSIILNNCGRNNAAFQCP